MSASGSLQLIDEILLSCEIEGNDGPVKMTAAEHADFEDSIRPLGLAYPKPCKVCCKDGIIGSTQHGLPFCCESANANANFGSGSDSADARNNGSCGTSSSNRRKRTPTPTTAAAAAAADTDEDVDVETIQVQVIDIAAAPVLHAHHHYAYKQASSERAKTALG
jgi:hypothetical protein